MYIILFQCFSTVCDIFIPSLIPRLSLAMYLTCSLSFRESQPHVSYKHISYIRNMYTKFLFGTDVLILIKSAVLHFYVLFYDSPHTYTDPILVHLKFHQIKLKKRSKTIALQNYKNYKNHYATKLELELK